MGGALDVPGNTSPCAECRLSQKTLTVDAQADGKHFLVNFFADPYAVKELLVPSLSINVDPEPPKPKFPLDRFLLLPLDITTPHELPFPIYQQRVDTKFVNASESPSKPKGKSPVTHFTSSFLEKTREIMLRFGKDAMELHDIVAVWCAIYNPPMPDGAIPNALGDGWKSKQRHFDVER